MHTVALVLTLTLVAVPMGNAAAAILASSTFDVGTEGWTLQNDATGPFHEVAGGNPGGHLRAVDLALGDTWRWIAPAAFRGDKSAAFGGRLRFDLSHSGLGTSFAASDVLLVDTGPTPDLILAFDAGPDPAFFPDWSSYVVPLDADLGWRVGSLAGPAATDAQLLGVLSSLDRLLIRGEFLSHPTGDVGRLDNVFLESAVSSSPAPLPATASLMGAAVGLLGLGAAIRRRRRYRP